MAAPTPLTKGNTANWALLTCPEHRAGDVEIVQRGAFTQVRCRECAKAAGTSAEKPAW